MSKNEIDSRIKNLIPKMVKKVTINIDGTRRKFNLFRKGGAINPTVRRYVRRFGDKNRGTNSISGFSKDVFLYKVGNQWDIRKAKTRGRRGGRATNLFTTIPSSQVRPENVRTFGGVKIDRQSGTFLTARQARGLPNGGNTFVNTSTVIRPTRTTQLQRSSDFFQSFRYEFDRQLTLQQIYAFARRQIYERGFDGSVVLWSGSTQDNRRYAITIDAAYLGSFEEFRDRITQLEGRDQNMMSTGSDRYFNDEEFIPDRSVIDIRFSTGETPAQVNGDAKNMMYEVENIPGGSRGLCGYEVLSKVLGEDVVEAYMTQRKINKHAFKSLDRIRDCLSDHNVGYNMYANAFHIPTREDSTGAFNFKHFMLRPERVKFTSAGRPINAYPVRQDDTEPNLIASQEGEGSPINFVVDTTGKSNHIDLCKNNILTLQPGICWFTSWIYKDLGDGKFKKICKRSTASSVTSQSRVEKMRFIFYDYETVVESDEKCFMKPYSLAYFIASLEDLKHLDEAERSNANITQILEGRSGCFTGWDCSEKFVDMICGLPSQYRYKLVGFNNSNFDNLLLADYIYTTQNTTRNKKDYNISNPFYNGNSLMNFTINGSITTFDLARHITGTSLKKCCKNFNVVNLAKKELDIPVPSHPHLKSHAAIQKLYELGIVNGNPDYLIDKLNDDEYRQPLIDYNIYDVVSLAVCFYRYREALLGIRCLKPYATEIWESLTIGSITWDLFSKTSDRNGLTIDKLTEEQYEYTMADSVAGRVDMFNGITRLKTKMCSIDVCSLYPFVCAVYNQAYFPVGKKHDVDFRSIGGLHGERYRNSEIWDKIGFYKCYVDQRCLADKNKVSIYPKKNRTDTGMVIENLWDLKDCGEMDDVCLSSVVIKQMMKAGCKVIIHEGYYFEEKVEGHKLFPFVLEFMAGKNQQDIWMKEGDPRYNASLRTAYKLFPNSLTGKVIEGLHLDTVQVVESEADFYKAKDKFAKVSVINQLGDAIFISCKKEVKDVINKQRPICYGRLIYDYAKLYMWTYAYSVGKRECVYSDTDSLKLTDLHYDRWKKWASKIKVPAWKEVEEYDARYKDHKLYHPHTKVFGSFEDEFDLDDAKIDESKVEDWEFILVGKKSYLYNVKVDGKWVNNKDWFRFKGVRPSSILLDENNLPDFAEKVVINRMDGSMVKKFRIKQDAEIHKITDFVEENTDLQVINNSIPFFRNMYIDGKSLVLCNSFRKIVKSSVFNEDLTGGRYEENNNKIQLCYTLKNLRIA